MHQLHLRVLRRWMASCRGLHKYFIFFTFLLDQEMADTLRGSQDQLLKTRIT